MLNEAYRNDRIHAFGELRSCPAATRVARSVAQQQVRHRAVRVIDHRDLLRQIIAALQVSWKNHAGLAGKRIRSAHMFVERSAVGEHQAGSRHIPHPCRCCHDGICRCMVYARAQVARVRKVERLVRVPDNRNILGGEVGKARYPPRITRPQRRRAGKPADPDRNRCS